MPAERTRDDPSPGAVYDEIGTTYAAFRRPDPRIARQIFAALGGARNVLNVGSGSGSYEPNDREVVGVEPSVTMIRQRPDHGPPVVRAVAEHLPFADAAFDAVLALLTVHHWYDVGRGFDEVERVAPVRIFLTWNNEVHWKYWLFDEYLPEIPEAESVLPAEEEITRRFPGSRVEVVPVPSDCTDGFCSAYWRRPERYLDPATRAAMSPIARLTPAVVERAMRRLRDDIESGTWERRHGDILGKDAFDCGLRLVVSDGRAPTGVIDVEHRKERALGSVKTYFGASITRRAHILMEQSRVGPSGRDCR
jgi:hypothetical protein